MRAWTLVPPLLLALASCPGCLGSPPRIQEGPDALTTPDGLHRVDDVPLGTLYMKPDYRVGTYRGFVLGATTVTFDRNTRQLDAAAVDDLKRRFDAAARRVIREAGTPEVTSPGPCVAEINLALIDMDLLDPRELSGGARTSVVHSYGAVTLVLEIRDSYTGEPLLRYGRRRLLEGGVGIGTDPATGAAMNVALQRFAEDYRQDLLHSVNRLQGTVPPLTCQQRAGRLPAVGEGP